MTIGTLRLKIRTFERGTISSEEPLSARIAEAPPVKALPEFDEDGRLYAFRFPRHKPAPAVIDRDRIFEYTRRTRRTADGGPIRLLPDIGVRGFVRDLKNRADFFTEVRELQTHADVESYSPKRVRRGSM